METKQDELIRERDTLRNTLQRCPRRSGRGGGVSGHTPGPWWPRLILTEDGSRVVTLSEYPHEHWSRFGCYDTEAAAVRAATFLFGHTAWAVRWSDHGWFYVSARAVLDKAEGGSV